MVTTGLCRLMRQTLVEAEHTWTTRADTNRLRATTLLTEGLVEDAWWHIREAKRCAYIADEIRSEIRRTNQNPLYDTDNRLSAMLAAEALGLATWDQDKGDWTWAPTPTSPKTS